MTLPSTVRARAWSPPAEIAVTFSAVTLTHSELRLPPPPGVPFPNVPKVLQPTAYTWPSLMRARLQKLPTAICAILTPAGRPTTPPGTVGCFALKPRPSCQHPSPPQDAALPPGSADAVGGTRTRASTATRAASVQRRGRVPSPVGGATPIAPDALVVGRPHDPRSQTR